MSAADEMGKHGHSRRNFLTRASMLGTAALVGFPRPAVAEPPPEITKIRLVQNGAICLAPQYLAEELLHLEGFSQVEYVPQRDDDPDPHVLVASGRADFTLDGATALVPALDAGRPLVVLAGVHGAATSSSGASGSGRSETSRAKASPSGGWELQITSTSPA
jgi:ABC-type nitrate/sulfonate/bicarbonate transport system substrate-binding protein